MILGRPCLHSTIRHYATNQTDSQNARALWATLMPGSVSWAPVTATLASTSTAGAQPRRPAQALTGQRIMIRDGKAVIVEPEAV